MSRKDRIWAALFAILVATLVAVLVYAAVLIVDALPGYAG